MFLKLVICPLAAVWFVKLLCTLEAPHADKVPVAPLASLIEMAIKFVTAKLDL
jgi:hypothetical protein